MQRTGSPVAVAAIALAGVAAVLWLPALWTPFWGDDYLFLQGAFASRVSGEPWWLPFWPDVRVQFWRPLGHETYWRVVEGVLGGDARAAHIVNLALWLAACSAVGVLGAVLAAAMGWERPRWTGALAGCVYAVWAVHFTPVHWTSSADSLLITLWSAAILAAWLRAPVSSPALRIALSVAIPALQVVALFSKESAVLLPALMLCASAVAWSRLRPGRPEVVAWLACLALIAAWLALRERFVLPPAPQYALALEDNVLRNAAALVAWCFNVPREALRMIVLGPRGEGLAWALAAALPMAASIAIAAQALRGRLTLRQLAAAAAFVAAAYAPYFILAWQSYEYYAQVAMIMPALLLARGFAASPRALAAAALLSISSYVAVEGSRMIDYPGLIGRARWAEEQLAALADTDDPELAVPGLEVHVSVGNPHRFHAIGRSGVAWRLGLPDDRVVVVEGCDAEDDEFIAFRGAEVAHMACAPWLGDDF